MSIVQAKTAAIRETFDKGGGTLRLIILKHFGSNYPGMP
jgi:hypothetical protein